MTEERKDNCGIKGGNRCRLCPRIDDLGYYMMCEGSPLQKINEKIITHFRESNPGISFEQIIFLDLKCDHATTHGLGWILATITKYVFECKYKETVLCINTFKSILENKLIVFNKLAGGVTTYTNVINIINDLLNVPS